MGGFGVRGVTVLGAGGKRVQVFRFWRLGGLGIRVEAGHAAAGVWV